MSSAFVLNELEKPPLKLLGRQHGPVLLFACMLSEGWLRVCSAHHSILILQTPTRSPYPIYRESFPRSRRSHSTGPSELASFHVARNLEFANDFGRVPMISLCMVLLHP